MSNKIPASNELSKEEKRRQARREYYQKNKVKLCKRTIEIESMRAINRDKMIGKEKANKLMINYPFDNYIKLVNITISQHGINCSKYAWQECNSAAHIAYMYSIYRCAAAGYDHVDNYIKKMVRIYIVCAIIIASDDIKHSSYDDFERVQNRNNYY